MRQKQLAFSLLERAVVLIDASSPEVRTIPLQ